MNFRFENQGANTYLVYEIGEEDELDSLSVGMLTNNRIAGLAPASFTQMDTSKYIKYNVSSKISATQLFSGVVNKKRLIGVFTGIVNAMLSAEDYMLNTDDLVLDLDYIFTDLSTCETVVICLPVRNRKQCNPELGMFFKNIIFNTQFDQTENCTHIAQIINFLNSSPTPILSDFKTLLEQMIQPFQPKPAPRMMQSKQPPQPPTQNMPMAKPTNPTPAPRMPQPPQPPQSPQPPQPQRPVSPGASPARPARPASPNRPEPPRHENLQFGSNYKPVSHAGPAFGTDKPHSPNPPENQAEKPMSMLYLLQHYSKENAALYKEQQGSKGLKKEAAPNPPSPHPAPHQAPPRQTAAAGKPGFSIPGQKEPAVRPGFAVPGVPGQPSAHPIPRQAPQSKPTPNLASAPAQPAQAVPAMQEKAPQSVHINFGETTVLGGGTSETTVLNETEKPVRKTPKLIRKKNNEKIIIDKPVFQIGKERSYVDYFISDNTAISRSHARIIERNGEFYVMDMNSTNHTYVDGVMIQSNVEIKLNDGARIRFANEDYQFKLD